MTRQQAHLTRALAHIAELRRAPDTTRRVYGNLCHTFPVLLRTDGLCQTLALLEEKAAGKDERAQAYRALRHHVAATLGLCQALAVVAEGAAARNEEADAYRALLDHFAGTGSSGGPPAEGGLLDRVRQADVTSYIRYTRVLLEAWVYYKRFAVSALGVRAGEAEVES